MIMGYSKALSQSHTVPLIHCLMLFRGFSAFSSYQKHVLYSEIRANVTQPSDTFVYRREALWGCFSALRGAHTKDRGRTQRAE